MFNEDGSIDIKVGYGMVDGLPNPGTKGRQKLARKMAQDGLERALCSLIDYRVDWGGFAQGRVDVSDSLIATKEGEK